MQADHDETVLLRYRYRDGTPQAALPMRVVKDDDTAVAAWLSTNTRIMYGLFPTDAIHDRSRLRSASVAG